VREGWANWDKQKAASESCCGSLNPTSMEAVV
jgi:hypothetical protein